MDAWKNDILWLVVVNSGEEMRMICSTCLKSKLPRTWARDGSCNIQRDTEVNHANSSEHKAAEQGLVCLKNKTIFHRGVMHQLSIHWVAYVVNSWLLESDILDINVVKKTFINHV